jgi:epsilon-lactone hydrolase
VDKLTIFKADTSCQIFCQSSETKRGARMASEEFKKALEGVKKWMQSSGLMAHEFDLGALRSAMSTSFFHVSDTTKIIEVNAGGVHAEWIIAPGAATDKRIAYFHGGGFTAGGLDFIRPFSDWLSKASGCSILIVDYRLAPENPFPAAVEDALTSYLWMCDHGPDGESQAKKTFIGGDSAGGGLALSTLLKLKDDSCRLPDAAVTMSAFTDLSLTGESIVTRASFDPICKPHLVKKHAELYLAGQDPRTPLASPLYGELSGLPPILMQVGDAEILLDDTVRFARKAEKAGVMVTLEVWPEMIHVWQQMAPLFPEAQQALDRIGEFIRSF